MHTLSPLNLPNVFVESEDFVDEFVEGEGTVESVDSVEGRNW